MGDPTRIRPASSLTTLPVPANSALAPRTHAPTLVGGQGDPDSVRVWDPDPKEFQRQGAFSGALGMLWPVFLAGGFVCFLIPLLAEGAVSPVFLLASGFLFVASLASGVGAEKSRARKRPCYLSTDESGIGVTTMVGTACFGWEEIIGVGYDPTAMDLTLRLANGEVRKLYLLGYSREQIDALLCLITEASDMLPDAMQGEGKWYLRAGFRYGPGMAVVRKGQEPLNYDWDAPALPSSGTDLTPAQKAAGVEILRTDRKRLATYSLCNWVGMFGCLEVGARTGHLIWGAMTMPLYWVIGGSFWMSTYCSTSQNGIRVHSYVGPRALRWDDITSLERRRFRLVLGSGERMDVKMFGCKRADVDALVDKIIERAQLVPDSERKNRWVRRPECEALAGTRVMLSGRD